ncbi:MAG: type I-MYXAN CRISPR-associated protein Cas6/Cmx6 [Burkholderiales bacterium]|nr:type I-MYXAN CRISPR-associated protein Cas6/Cmx6 [Burkholderiales bacterium]
MDNEVSDMVFDLKAGFVPADYAFSLWDELVRILPWLETLASAGILPLKGAESGGGILLPQRAKLVLRLPEKSARNALELTGSTLDIGGDLFEVGSGRKKCLEPYPTLHSKLVASEQDEAGFLIEIAAKLAELDIPCKWICGRRQTGRVAGYSLVIHDLKPAGSIRLQQTGLGDYRRFGCGVFVPHKTISGLD